MVKLYKYSLWLSIPIILIGAIFKIQHYPFASIILLFGYLISLIYIVIGLIDVIKNDTMSNAGKILWMAGFLFTAMITGLVD